MSRMTAGIALGVALVLSAAGTALASGTLVYSATNFVERWQNDGGIANAVVVTLTNTDDRFAGTNGVDFVSLGWVTPANVPAGLTATVTRMATNFVLLSLSGNAASHTAANNIGNLSFAFGDTAFSNGPASSIVNAGGVNMSVVFLAQNSSNWYVSSAGGSDTNGNGTAGNPYATVAKAISMAQASANDVINVAPGTNTEFNLTLNKVLTIQGHGRDDTVLQAYALPFVATNRVIFSGTSSNLVLRNLTLRYGNATGGSGGALSGPGNGAVEFYIDSCRFYQNASSNNGAAIDVFNNGGNTQFWTAVNTEFIGNRARYDGGAIRSYNQNLTLSNCLMSGNSATRDGGAVICGGDLRVSDSFFTNNTAANCGGAINHYSGHVLTADRCAFIGNVATTNGGAVYSSTASPYLRNCTLYGNRAGINGGGLWYNWNSGSAYLYNSTLTMNSAQNGGGVQVNYGQLNLYSSIVASNTASSTGPDINFAGGGNPVATRCLVGINNAAGASVTLTNGLPNSSGNYVGTNSAPLNAWLIPISDRGGNGKALVCRPLPVSAAIDHGTNTLGFATDQRGPGFPRVVGTQCDMGSYETGSGPARLVYNDNAFDEAPANDGSIDNTTPLQIALDEGIDAFTGTNGADFVADGKLMVANLPAGLTVVASKQNATNVSVTVAGKATANNAADSVYNLTFVFQTNALVIGVVTSAFNYAVTNLQILFNDNVSPSLTYGGSVFNESSANDGSISTAISITLSNDTLTGVSGDDFVADNKVLASNVPIGLTAVVTRQTPKILTATLRGNALAHNAANDIGNVTFAFQNSAFAGANAAIVTAAVKTDFAVQFLDPALTYAAKTFNEAWVNDGSIANTLPVSLAGDSFSGVNGDDFVASGKVTPVGLPDGLTAVVTRQNATSLSIALLGNATNSASFQNVTNLGFTFAGTAFAGAQATIVTNYNVSDLSILWLLQDSSNLYVSALNGIDTNTYSGSMNQPFHTLGYALTRVQTLANDTIHLLPGVYTESNLTINANVVITGNTRDDTIVQAWPTPFAAPNFQILNVVANLTLRNLTLRHANVSVTGGAIGCGNSTALITVDGCRLTLNASTNGGGGAIGWVSNNAGMPTLTVRNTEVSYNRAYGTVAGGGNGNGGGGGIWNNRAAISIDACVFVGNNGYAAAGTNLWDGGAIFSSAGYPISIGASTFASNSAADAGAVSLVGAASVVVSNSTFMFNVATNNGGAFCNSQNSPTLLNCTFYGNVAATGGALNVFNNGAGTISLYNTTVFSNSASVMGGGIYDYEALYLYSTIVAGNVAPQGPDVYRVIATSVPVDSFSLVGNNANSYLTAGLTNANGSYIGTTNNVVDPRVLALADNGGKTLTCALWPDSPAIDHGSNPLGLPWDQRGAGFDRAYRTVPDIGAFENGAHLPLKGLILIVQ